MAGRGLPAGMGGLGGGMDPRQVSGMMKRLGIDVRDIEGVEEVVVRTASADYVFDRATVSVMKAQGVETWQVSGVPRKVPKGGAGAVGGSPATGPAGSGADTAPADDESVPYEPAAEDIELVRSQTGAGEKEVRAALVATGGDLAEAILRLKA